MPAFKAVIALGVLCCPLVFCDDHKEKVNPDPTTNGRHFVVCSVEDKKALNQLLDLAIKDPQDANLRAGMDRLVAGVPASCLSKKNKDDLEALRLWYGVLPCSLDTLKEGKVKIILSPESHGCADCNGRKSQLIPRKDDERPFHLVAETNLVMSREAMEQNRFDEPKRVLFAVDKIGHIVTGLYSIAIDQFVPLEEKDGPRPKFLTLGSRVVPYRLLQTIDDSAYLPRWKSVKRPFADPKIEEFAKLIDRYLSYPKKPLELGKLPGRDENYELRHKTIVEMNDKTTSDTVGRLAELLLREIMASLEKPEERFKLFTPLVSQHLDNPEIWKSEAVQTKFYSPLHDWRGRLIANEAIRAVCEAPKNGESLVVVQAGAGHAGGLYWLLKQFVKNSEAEKYIDVKVVSDFAICSCVEKEKKQQDTYTTEIVDYLTKIPKEDQITKRQLTVDLLGKGW